MGISKCEDIEITGKRSTYSGSFKARIVSELINGKKSLKDLAEYYNVHPNQIKNWKAILLQRAGDVLEDRRKTQSPGRKNTKV
jgi:transposase